MPSASRVEQPRLLSLKTALETPANVIAVAVAFAIVLGHTVVPNVVAISLYGAHGAMQGHLP